MPKTKPYRDLSRSQQYRRRKKIDEAFANITHKENELHLEGLQKNVEIVKTLRDNISFSNDENEDDINFSELPKSTSDVCFEENELQLNSTDDYDKGNNERFGDLHSNPHAEYSLQQFLKNWAVEHNITHIAMNMLLKGLRRHGHENLPCDSRTLFQTSKVSSVTHTTSGCYYYHGLEKGLTDHLNKTRSCDKVTDSTIKIYLSIDGLLLAKSSKSQLWPLLGQVVHKCYREKPFFIAGFHGYCKPSTPNQILHDFIREYQKIQSEEFQYLGRKYIILVHGVICDTPARAFVKSVKSHTGYHGCERCNDEGEWRNNRMLFLNENAPLRTDESFLLKKDEEHHLDISPFENAGFRMITQFPLDYMHLICLGIVKRILKFWIKGQKGVKLRYAEIERLSMDLKSMRPYIPVEFSRKPRGLDEIDRWKATEFRSFLLYIGFVLVCDYLPQDYVKHFYCLHCAIYILCDPSDYDLNGDYANELLRHFVQGYKLLYTEDHVTYNVHNLIHLYDDVKIHKWLDMFSAFPFENFLQELKKMLRKGAKPLQQLQRRLEEKSKIRGDFQKSEQNNYPILKKCKRNELPFLCTCSHEEIKFQNFTLSCTKEADKFCYTTDKRVLSVEYIGYKHETEIVIAKVLQNSSGVPFYPCDSHNLGIHVGNEWSHLEIIPASSISRKMLRLPFKDTNFFIPILHTSD